MSSRKFWSQHFDSHWKRYFLWNVCHIYNLLLQAKRKHRKILEAHISTLFVRADYHCLVFYRIKQEIFEALKVQVYQLLFLKKFQLLEMSADLLWCTVQFTVYGLQFKAVVYGRRLAYSPQETILNKLVWLLDKDDDKT